MTIENDARRGYRRRPTMTDGQPLTFAQRRIWSLAQIGTEAVLGHQILACACAGHSTRARLSIRWPCWSGVMPAMRTRFSRHAGSRIEQHVDDAAGLPLGTIDLGRNAPQQREAELALRLSDEPLLEFDLDAEPPARAQLLRLAADDHVLALSLHALVCDAPSLRILAHDLLAAYGALAAGRAPELPQLRVPDPAPGDGWERSEAGRAALAYWGALLTQGALATFPAAKPSGDAASGNRGLHRLTFGAERSAALRKLACQLDMPLAAVVLTAIHLLLARYDSSGALAGRGGGRR